MSNKERARALVDKHEASYNRAGMLEGAYDLDIEDLITAALDEKDARIAAIIRCAGSSDDETEEDMRIYAEEANRTSHDKC